MRTDIKRTVAFMFFLLAGIILGSAIAYLCQDISAVSWLAYNFSIGMSSPFVLDLIVFELTFGINLAVNAAQLICVIIALIIYAKTCRSI